MFDRSSATLEADPRQRADDLRNSREITAAKVVLRLAADELPIDANGGLRAYFAQPGKLNDAAGALTKLARDPAFDAAHVAALSPQAAAVAPHLAQFVRSLPSIKTPEQRLEATAALTKAVEIGGQPMVAGFIDRAIEDQRQPLPSGAQRSLEKKPTIEVICHPGEQNPELRKPLPNRVYLATEVDARGNKLATRSYETDSLGRTIHAEGQLLDIKGTRNQTDQQKVGGKDRRRGTPDPNDDPRNGRDDGGHLIATEFNGPGEAINMVAMDSRLNEHGPWRKMEEHWGDELRAGHKVKVDIRPIYRGNSLRPDALKVIENIDGKIKSYTFKNEPEGK